ncbi:MAG TPA: hypothetical protein VGQ81_05325 [Acidobacteriota bacterium]|jgi:hypothetical protein|nr:hypothetical protein [Acidobacteriota bacterium]
MKKSFAATILVIAILGLLPQAQNTQSPLFDLKRSRHELEIMSGILQTTLNFALQELQSRSPFAKREGQRAQSGSPGGAAAKAATGRIFYVEMAKFSGINGFYLYGQGGIFIIPTGNLRHKFEAFDTALVDESVRALVEPSTLAPAPPQRAPAPQVSPAPSAGADKSGGKSGEMGKEELRKKLADAQENFKRRREQEVLQQGKVDELLGEIKAYLIEALANHGDSLSQVKQNEYVTLVFSDGSPGYVSGYFGLIEPRDGASQPEIISVQKSAIMDYKAGKLSLESFKQKVLDYRN